MNMVAVPSIMLSSNERMSCMKEIFENPELTVYVFAMDDVITASNGGQDLSPEDEF